MAKKKVPQELCLFCGEKNCDCDGKILSPSPALAQEEEVRDAE